MPVLITDMNNQQAFDMIVELVSERIETLITTTESINYYSGNNLIHGQIIKEAKEINQLLEYLVKRLEVHMPNQ